MQKRAKTAENIRILGIETSCDETSVALLTSSMIPPRRRTVGTSDVGRLVLKKHFISTQIPIHARYGGVVPEVAARTHVAELVTLLDKTLGWSKSKSKNQESKIGDTFDAVAVTYGPGLATALRVGIEAAKNLAWAYSKPLVPVNHLEGHMASAWLVPQNRKHWEYPILFLLVSGGHTELVLMKEFGKYKILGRTRDDAAGEAFDKTAKLLGLEYPGGPKLSKLAAQGNPKAFDLPRPMINDPSLDFSFSGLKTAVRQLVENTTYNSRKSTVASRQSGEEGRNEIAWDGRRGTMEDLCASIQAAIIDVLVGKTVKATLKAKPKAIAVVGGVSANPLLKEELKKALKKSCSGVKLLAPAKGLYTDNGAMIAAAGLWKYLEDSKGKSLHVVDAQPDLDL